MAKSTSSYQCQACGGQASKWAGQCGECGAWNTLVETAATTTAPRFDSFRIEPARVQKLADVQAVDDVRIATGIGEFDRVLGGGLVAGSAVLIGGDPGVGKSTLLMQAIASCQRSGRLNGLYVSGEESASQIALRTRRLGIDAGGVALLTETNVERILEQATSTRPDFMVIDSIQTLWSGGLTSAPGAVGQVRECAAQLVRFAKSRGTAVYLIGHVTKDGTLAGPRVLEHMVDAVLYFEGDSSSRFRVVRAVKNRFGAVNELGVFTMTDTGLREVTNPSAIFLSRHEKPVAGSVVMVTREGTRPLLVEVQALVDETQLSNPRRVTLGLEHGRLSMLLAVLHRHGGVVTGNQDVFVNVVGGVRVTETGADLPVVLAVLSSWRNRVVPPDLVTFGEIGLTGEIRPVQNGPERLREAQKHGFRRALVPKANIPRGGVPDLDITSVSRLEEILDQF